MSGEIKGGESYFLQGFACNCVVEDAKRVRGKRGISKKRSVFLLRVTHSCLCKRSKDTRFCKT
ncbi:hypothetical protein [Campylobacter troglodytis]|uniref:hypothetical protein n=1 Tax=Campylobacter troglodytis TaxID=654363 RepID=UPI00115A5A36|nr:hypothetical protein [Campylobacter troglodytis]